MPPSHNAQSKSSVDEIRARFDADVERFSNKETGQTATVDSALVLELVVQTAAAVTPGAKHVVDVGCGAGNYTLRLLEILPQLHCTLIDLSKPMLDRAMERIAAAHLAAGVVPIQGDIREIHLPEESADIILAAAVLHHLRDEDEWRATFAKFHRALRPGGAIWISDLVQHTLPPVQDLMWRRYGEYLSSLKNDAYRDSVFEYIEKEDSPRPLMYQLRLLEELGFGQIEILHKNSCFAAFGAVKAVARL